MCSVVILTNFMVSMINIVYQDVRERHLYGYDEEMVEYLNGWVTAKINGIKKMTTNIEDGNAANQQEQISTQTSMSRIKQMMTNGEDGNAPKQQNQTSFQTPRSRKNIINMITGRGDKQNKMSEPVLLWRSDLEVANGMKAKLESPQSSPKSSEPVLLSRSDFEVANGMTERREEPLSSLTSSEPVQLSSSDLEVTNITKAKMKGPRSSLLWRSNPTVQSFDLPVSSPSDVKQTEAVQP